MPRQITVSDETGEKLDALGQTYLRVQAVKAKFDQLIEAVVNGVMGLRNHSAEAAAVQKEFDDALASTAPLVARDVVNPPQI